MYPAGNLFIPAPHGQLEAILKEAEPEQGVALVLHPHPLHGGTMHNKVVFRAARALNNAGLTTLRINFRGVGQSTGTHDEGRGEGDDARAALDYLSAHYPHQPVTLAGFSFGARVGLEVGVADERVKRLVGIGTPAKMYDFSFLKSCRKPLLLVHGENDEISGADELLALVDHIPAEARTTVKIIPGVGHFFDERLDEMMRVMEDWLSITKV